MAAQGPTPAEFLRTLWGDVKGFAELAAIQGPDIKSFPFTYPDSLDSFLFAAKQHNKTHNVYMGICLKKEKWPRWNGRYKLKGGKQEKDIEWRGTEDNALSAGAVWCEFDFTAQGHKGKTVPEEVARKWLHEFKFKPSIIVKSGGGIQVFWLLKEIVQGDDLWRVKGVNSAFCELWTMTHPDGKKGGADPQSVDLARVFRIPESMNLKYTPHRQAVISWWKPDFRYTLEDFEGLLAVKETEKPKPPPSPAPNTAPPAQTHSSPGTNGQAQGARPIPSLTIPDDKVQEIGKLFAEIWFEGHRHQMALCVAGMLAYSGVVVESAVAVIRVASDIVKGDTEKRCKDAEDTYQNYLDGKEITGAPTLEKIIDEDLPAAMRAPTKKVLEKIRRLLPRPPKPPQGYLTNIGFTLPKIIKFTSETPIYEVTIEKDGQERRVRTENLFLYKEFERDVYNKTNFILPDMKQRQWKGILDMTPQEERQAPQEATLEGAIEFLLEEFFKDAKENPEPGLLKRFPGYNDQGRYMRAETFLDFATERGFKIQQRDLYDYLHKNGWSNATRRYHHGQPQKYWFQPFVKPSGNGHTVPDDHGPTNGKAAHPKETTGVQEPSLFSESESAVQPEPSQPDEDWGIT